MLSIAIVVDFLIVGEERRQWPIEAWPQVSYHSRQSFEVRSKKGPNFLNQNGRVPDYARTRARLQRHSAKSVSYITSATMVVRRVSQSKTIGRMMILRLDSGGGNVPTDDTTIPTSLSWPLRPKCLSVTVMGSSHCRFSPNAGWPPC